MPEARGPDELLAFALLDLDPRVQALQQPLHLFLVSLVLHRSGPLRSDGLQTAVDRELPHGSAISADDVAQAVSAGVAAGLLERGPSEEEVRLTELRSTQLSTASSRLEKLQAAFHRHLEEHASAQLGEPLTQEQRQRLHGEVQRFLQAVFQAKSVALAHAFGPDGGGFDESMDLLPKKSLSRIASRVVPENDPIRRAQVAVALRDALLSLPTDAQAHLAAEYQKTVAFALLAQDPTVRRIRRALTEQRLGYLDTNVAMALLFEAHPKHDLARRVLETTKAAGCSLCVSKFTFDELKLQLQESNTRMRRLKVPGEVLSVLSDDIVRTFRAREVTSPGLSWTTFFAAVSPPDQALKDLGVEVDLSSWGAAPLDERRDDVRDAVRRTKPNFLPAQLIDFDAHNLLLMQILRETRPPDELGNRVWLVTIDRSLRAAEKRILKEGVFPAPSSIRAQTWCTYIASQLGPDDDSLQHYVLHLVQSQLGLLAEDPVFVDTNFLITLQESPFDLGRLLSGSAETTRRVLVALQEEKEVRALLTQPPIDEPAAGPWVEQLSAAVDRSLTSVEANAALEDRLKATNAELDHAKRAADTLRRERDEQLRRVAELQERTATSAASKKNGWLARLRAWFAGE